MVKDAERDQGALQMSFDDKERLVRYLPDSVTFELRLL